MICISYSFDDRNHYPMIFHEDKDFICLLALLLLGLGIQLAFLCVVSAYFAVTSVVSDTFARVGALRIVAG